MIVSVDSVQSIDIKGMSVFLSYTTLLNSAKAKRKGKQTKKKDIGCTPKASNDKPSTSECAEEKKLVKKKLKVCG